VIITLTPNPSIDRTLVVTRLVRGHVHRATAEHEEPSGKGVNVSRALTRNGVDSIAVLPLGGDEGLKLARLLDEEGVRYRPVRIAGPVRVNVSLTEPDGLATKVNSLGPLLSAAEVVALTGALAELVAAGDWVVASGSLPRGVEDGYYAGLAEVVHAAGARFALDSSGSALRGGLAGRPDVIKPNIEELEEAVGQRVTTVGDVVSSATALLGRGAGSVLVSLGSDGALLVTADGAWHAQAGAVEPKSTIGAGDALLAGFISAGGHGPQALAEAVAWGTASVGAEGSRVPVITDRHRRAVVLSDELGRNSPLSERAARQTA
jgi:1-phosphofructokinase